MVQEMLSHHSFPLHLDEINYKSKSSIDHPCCIEEQAIKKVEQIVEEEKNTRKGNNTAEIIPVTDIDSSQTQHLIKLILQEHYLPTVLCDL